MKTILLILLASVLMSTTLVNSGLITIKPATPRYVFVCTVGQSYAQNTITKKAKEGYILKQMVGTGRYGVITIVMEKY